MVASLPLELFAGIAEHLDDAQKLSLSLTSKSLCTFVLPLLYTHLHLQDIQCLTRIQFLLARPHLTRFVRQLVLVPTNVTTTTQRSAQKHVANEVELAKAVELLTPNLSSLEKFIWDGMELPHDHLWEALRRCCPLLKFVGANIGTKPLNSDCQLFAFDDLEGFWLSSEVRESPNRERQLGTQGESLPSTCWDMIIHRSPQLRSLTLGHRGISLRSHRMLDVTPIIRAAWPKLVSLKLESCRLIGDGSGDEDLRTFGRWISSHQTLKHLSVHGLPDLRYRQLLGNLESLGCAMTLDSSSPSPLSSSSFSSAGPNSSPEYEINMTIEDLVLMNEPYDGRTFRAVPEYGHLPVRLHS
ncbi:hypothetical protein L218DRAFT_722977 [Marasmius fiardii PR-910]|nr:hypothetical protein L218DRAFT_722977 [Marasmius fiardii PR-910]